jgi:hypothetical protein
MTGNDLRELIQGKLLTLCDNVYYFLADERRMYPHIVFNLSRSTKYDFARDDVTLDVDIFAKSEADAQDLADAVETMFNNLNDPQSKLLPTFFVERITNVVDADKDIRHKSVEVTVQNYERS